MPCSLSAGLYLTGQPSFTCHIDEFWLPNTPPPPPQEILAIEASVLLTPGHFFY